MVPCFVLFCFALGYSEEPGLSEWFMALHLQMKELTEDLLTQKYCALARREKGAFSELPVLEMLCPKTIPCVTWAAREILALVCS